MSVTIIAEAGVNHNGDIQLAFDLIEMAKSAGADVVKFQSFEAERLATASANLAAYQRENTKVETSQFTLLKKLEMDDDFHAEVIAHCAKHKIEFLSTAFDIVGLEKLYDWGVKRIKVPSGEITHLPYLEKAGSLGLPVILSSGMATMDEIAAARDILLSAGLSPDKLTVLHCTTNYPAADEELNLNAMQAIGEQLNVAIGYSDHSIGPEASIACTALGATVIEKHVTMDSSFDGPDHSASMEPDDFAAMVRSIRAVEAMLGDGIKRPIGAEIENIQIVRKSLVAAVPIKRGEILTADNVIAKRPGGGLSPMHWHDVIGTTAVTNFDKDAFIVL